MFPPEEEAETQVKAKGLYFLEPWAHTPSLRSSGLQAGFNHTAWQEPACSWLPGWSKGYTSSSDTRQ